MVFPVYVVFPAGNATFPVFGLSFGLLAIWHVLLLAFWPFWHALHLAFLRLSGLALGSPVLWRLDMTSLCQHFFRFSGLFQTFWFSPVLAFIMPRFWPSGMPCFWSPGLLACLTRFWPLCLLVCWHCASSGPCWPCVPSSLCWPYSSSDPLQGCLAVLLAYWHAVLLAFWPFGMP